MESNSTHSEQKHDSFLGENATSVLCSFCHLFLLSDNKINTALVLDFRGRNRLIICYREQINCCTKLDFAVLQGTLSRVVFKYNNFTAAVHSITCYMYEFRG